MIIICGNCGASAIGEKQVFGLIKCLCPICGVDIILPDYEVMVFETSQTLTTYI